MLTVLILPITCMILFHTFSMKQEALADRLAKTILAYEILILLMANLLSIGSHISRWYVFGFWLVSSILIVLWGVRKYKGTYFKVFGNTEGKNRKDKTDVAGKWKEKIGKLSAAETCMLFLGVVLLVILLVGALFTVPYNYDSMTYHLSRIGYWLDHGNVNYYVTNIDRQLFSPVLAEYNLLAVMVLCSNDVLLNLQQYIAMLLTAYYLYQIARKIGTSRRFSAFAAFAYLTMPLTITQAITTQNDLSAGLFFALFVYELLWFVQAPKQGDAGDETAFGGRKMIEKSILVGLTVGFAFLMKVSVCASMILFMPWVLVSCIRRRDKPGSLLKAGLCAGISMFFVMLETLIRTYQACGSFMADTTSGDIMVATKNVSYIIVNILKNYSLLITQHFWTGLNGFVYRIAIRVGALLHVEVNNIAISYHGFDFITYLNTGEDMYSHDRTSSAFVSYLALIAGVLLVVSLVRLIIGSIRRKKEKGVGERKSSQNICYGYVISAWLGFGFIMALLRWQPWGSRLMYPALTMTVVASAHMLDVYLGSFKQKDVVPVLLALMSLLLCLKPIQYNMVQSMDYLSDGCQNRMSHYFVHNDRSRAYQQLMEQAREMGATDIAVVISGDGYDYPLWKMFHDNYPEATLRHIIVDDTKMVAQMPSVRGVNVSGRNAKGQAKTLDDPDCILWIERGLLEKGETLDYFGTTYECVFVSDSEKAPDSMLVKQ